jgi:hypothetical protein
MQVLGFEPAWIIINDEYFLGSQRMRKQCHSVYVWCAVWCAVGLLNAPPCGASWHNCDPPVGDQRSTDRVNKEKSKKTTIVKIYVTENRLAMGPHVMIGSWAWLRPVFPRDKDEPKHINLYVNREKMKRFGTRNAIVDRTDLATGMVVKKACATNVMNKVRDNSLVGRLPQDLTAPRKFHLSFFNHCGFSGVISIMRPSDPVYRDFFSLYYCGNGQTSHALDILFESLNTPMKWVATVHPDNIPSVMILKKHGFTRHQRGVPKYGSIRDVYILDTTTTDPIQRGEKDADPIAQITGHL